MNIKKRIFWDTKCQRLCDQFTDTVDKLINCCWEKVVASTKSVSYKHLREYSSEAVAVAMEGNGFY